MVIFAQCMLQVINVNMRPQASASLGIRSCVDKDFNNFKAWNTNKLIRIQANSSKAIIHIVWKHWGSFRMA